MQCYRSQHTQNTFINNAQNVYKIKIEKTRNRNNYSQRRQKNNLYKNENWKEEYKGGKITQISTASNTEPEKKNQK